MQDRATYWLTYWSLKEEQKMKKEIRYIANDGTVFEDMRDCEKYEILSQFKNCNCKFWDCNFNLMSLSDDFYQIPEDACYILINDYATYVAVINYFDKLGGVNLNANYNIAPECFETPTPQLFYYGSKGWHWWNLEMSNLEDIAGQLRYEY